MSFDHAILHAAFSPDWRLFRGRSVASACAACVYLFVCVCFLSMEACYDQASLITLVLPATHRFAMMTDFRLVVGQKAVCVV